jgi:DNA-binding response OmpR family regulator
MSKGLALVIEDDFDASVIFAKAMEVLGFEPEIIRTGDAAQERLKTAVPVIVVLDLHLPQVVGTDLLRQIREDARLLATRVIVATADPRMAELIQDQADLVLIKPTTYSQVRDLAERLVSRPRSKSKRFASASPDSAASVTQEAAAVPPPPAEAAAPPQVVEKPTEPKG